MLETEKAKFVYEMSLQIGLEEKIVQQKVIPKWFFQDASTDYSSKFPGTYWASWTFIASPSCMS